MGCKEISQRVGEVGGHHCARLSCLNVKYNRVSVCMNSQIFSKDRSQNPVNQNVSIFCLALSENVLSFSNELSCGVAHVPLVVYYGPSQLHINFIWISGFR